MLSETAIKIIAEVRREKLNIDQMNRFGENGVYRLEDEITSPYDEFERMPVIEMMRNNWANFKILLERLRDEVERLRA